MQNIFTVTNFEFPYQYKFPGQATDEKILFVTRENSIMLWFRRVLVVIIALALFFSATWLASLVKTFGLILPSAFNLIAFLIAAGVGAIGWWWITSLWKKSLGFVTTKRLTKFVYTTPFNRYNLSLPLDMVVDTGSYTKGFLPALFKLGTFTARSSATSSGVATDDEDRINKKYFYMENLAIAEDLQHYVNKVLTAYRQHQNYLPNFRPFIPHLKGEKRKEFMEKYPEYWS